MEYMMRASSLSGQLMKAWVRKSHEETFNQVKKETQLKPSCIMWEGPNEGDLRILKFKNKSRGASLVAQWLRIRPPMQGTWVQALVREDPTCRGATKPMRHSY